MASTPASYPLTSADCAAVFGGGTTIDTNDVLGKYGVTATLSSLTSATLLGREDTPANQLTVTEGAQEEFNLSGNSSLYYGFNELWTNPIGSMADQTWGSYTVQGVYNMCRIVSWSGKVLPTRADCSYFKVYLWLEGSYTKSGAFTKIQLQDSTNWLYLASAYNHHDYGTTTLWEWEIAADHYPNWDGTGTRTILME